MFNTLILTALLASPQSGDIQRARVDHLVELAWQQSDKASAATDSQGKPESIVIDAKRQKDLDRDTDLGKQYAKEVDKELHPSQNDEYIKRVKRIGGEMAVIANSMNTDALWGDKRPAKFDYEFRVVQGEDVNAFSLPGGIIYVYEGLVKYVESDDELAGVLGHEISHAKFRHVYTLQRQSEKLQIGQLLTILVAAMTKSRDAANVAIGTQLASQSAVSTWSVDAEEAADYGGLQLIEKSKYNATGMVTMMERLARDEKSRPSIDWGIYRTHPPSKERVQSLIGYMNAAHYPIKRSAVTKSFRTQIKPGDEGTVEAWFNGKKIYTFAGPEALGRADDAAKKLDDFFDQVPQMIEVTDSDNAVLYNFHPLLEISTADASAQNMTVRELAAQTTKTIKGALFTLAYRIWG